MGAPPPPPSVATDRTADFLAALERCARPAGPSAAGAPSAAHDTGGLRKRRGTLLSRQGAAGPQSPAAPADAAGSSGIVGMVRDARARLLAEDRERAMETRSGRFGRICEEKMLEASSLEVELQRLDRACRGGYGLGGPPGGTAEDPAGMEERAVQRLSALQRDVDRLKDAAALGGTSSDGDAVMSAHRHGMVRRRLAPGRARPRRRRPSPTRH